MTNQWRRAVWAGIVLSCFAVGALGQAAAGVKVFPAEASVAVGQTIEVTIQAENVSNLFGIELSIRFNASVLEVVDADANKPGTQITAGGFLSPDLETTNEVANDVINYAVQQVSPHNPVSGNGVLARITFRAKSAGTSNIALEDVFLFDQNGNGITTVLHNGVLSVTSSGGQAPTATPAPPAPTTAPATSPPTATPAHVSAPAASTGYNCTNIQGYHIVKRGETLYAIARAYATDPYAIGACNPTINPRRIHASNHLAIPYAPWTPPPGPTAERQFGPSLIPAPVPTPEPGCRARHVVQPGETLTAIGLRYSADLWNIARANRIYNLHLIHAGQVLCIP